MEHVQNSKLESNSSNIGSERARETQKREHRERQRKQRKKKKKKEREPFVAQFGIGRFQAVFHVCDEFCVENSER